MTTPTDTLSGNTSEIFRQTRYTNRPYHSPVGERLPLIAVFPTSDGSVPTNRVFNMLNGAGFNATVMNLTKDDAEDAALSAHNYGLFTILSSPGLVSEKSSDPLSDCVSAIKDLKNSNGIVGYLLKDSPYTGITESDKTLVAKIGEADTEKTLIHILSQKYANSGSGFSDYTRFMAYVQTALLPEVWVADTPDYIILSSGCSGEWYRRLINSREVFAMMARYSARPFWVTVSGFLTQSDQTSGKPGKGKMMVSALSALVRGAKGIMFTNPVVALNDIAQINSRILELERIFLYSQYIQGAVYSRDADSGKNSQSEIPVTTEGNNREILYTSFDAPIGPLTGISTSGRGIMIAHMCVPPINNEADASDILVILNLETEKSQSVSLSFNDYYSVKEVVKAPVKAPMEVSSPAGLDNTGSLTKTIDPGDCIVYKWT